MPHFQNFSRKYVLFYFIVYLMRGLQLRLLIAWLYFISDHSKPLPAHVSVKNSRKDEDDEFDGSGSENELVDIESEPEPVFDEDELEDDEDDNAFLE